MSGQSRTTPNKKTDPTGILKIKIAAGAMAISARQTPIVLVMAKV